MKTPPFTSSRVLTSVLTILAAVAAALAGNDRPAKANTCNDPYIPKPRPNCQWIPGICNYSCPGYTASQVSVQVLRPPTTSSSVELHLLNICDASPRSCNPTVTVTSSETAASHCQLLATAVSRAECGAAGFVVSADHCLGGQSYFTVRNNSCSVDSIVGVSTTSVFGTFDQTYLGPLPDGEVDSITATPPAPPVPVLQPWGLALLVGAIATAGVQALRRSTRA